MILRALHSVPVIRPSSDLPDIADCPLVSVIVPARNEENNIRQCIVSLLEQDYPKMEIIIANDNSVDRTEDIIRSFGERVICFNAPPTPPGWTGKNAALHAAVDKASGEWLLFPMRTQGMNGPAYLPPSGMHYATIWTS